MDKWYENENGELFNLSKAKMIIKDVYNGLYQIRAIFDKTDWEEEDFTGVIFECNDKEHRDFHFNEMVKLLNAEHTTCQCWEGK